MHKNLRFESTRRDLKANPSALVKSNIFRHKMIISWCRFFCIVVDKDNDSVYITVIGLTQMISTLHFINKAGGTYIVTKLK
jgi:hypothetical protein